jgi:hypothetical protein
MLLWGTLLLTGVGMLLQGGEAQETNCPETILCDKADQRIQNRFLRIKFASLNFRFSQPTGQKGVFLLLRDLLHFIRNINDNIEAVAFETNFVF